MALLPPQRFNRRAPLGVLGLAGALVVAAATPVGSSRVAAVGLLAVAITVLAWRLRSRSEESLRQAERQFRAVAESAPDAMVSADAEGRIIAWNGAAATLFGYAPDEVVGRSLTMLMPERFRDAHERGMARFLDTGQPKMMGAVVDVFGLRPDGEEFPMELHVAHWERDGERCFTGIIRDITDRRRTELALAREAGFVRLLQAITEAANETSDATTALQRAVELICEHTGWPVGHVYHVVQASPPLVSSGIWHLADERRYEPFRSATADIRFISGEGLPGRVLKSGRPAWLDDVTRDGNFPRLECARRTGLRTAMAFPVLIAKEVIAVLEFYAGEVLEPDEPLVQVMAQVGMQLGRVVERQRAAQMAYRAMHDPLTGLPNRTMFLDRLARALTSASDKRCAAVLVVDLDRFKIVNDSLGHEAGDELLLAVAGRLRALLRPDDVIARLGGDEFAVLCEDLRDEEAAADVADRISRALADSFVLAGNEVFVTASTGIATAGGAGSPEELLRDADAALHRAKDGGRARHETFREAMRPRSAQRLETLNDLHRAVDRDELFLHYQPQLELGSQRIVGVEALVRWQHPVRGIIPPMEFIPLAEETGLIVALGRWVLTESCRQAALWQQRFPAPRSPSMSINISAKQLQHRAFFDDVVTVLSETGVDPRGLVFEITESVLASDAGTATVHRLKDLGIRLAIDDFGTGYSSLTYLSRFPVDVLKIDRSFVEGLGCDPDATAMAATIVALARTLGLETVAEGVERSEQIAELTELGCDLAQGFYFARPVKPETVEGLLWQAHREAGSDRHASPAVQTVPSMLR